MDYAWRIVVEQVAVRSQEVVKRDTIKCYACAVYLGPPSETVTTSQNAQGWNRGAAESSIDVPDAPLTGFPN